MAILQMYNEKKKNYIDTCIADFQLKLLLFQLSSLLEIKMLESDKMC